MNLFKLSGILSLVFGTLSCLILIKPYLLMFALLSAIIGFIFSTLNIYMNAKYEITKKAFSVGYVGMMLSSFPVIFLLVIIIRNS
ncbi:MAG: hypothetical protein K9H41_06785 [Bacteroidia bacterium]|nr:hypothetical protein [Bacteroidia bacterium]